jgi:hypothetical protein
VLYSNIQVFMIKGGVTPRKVQTIKTYVQYISMCYSLRLLHFYSQYVSQTFSLFIWYIPDDYIMITTTIHYDVSPVLTLHCYTQWIIDLYITCILVHIRICSVSMATLYISATTLAEKAYWNLISSYIH